MPAIQGKDPPLFALYAFFNQPSKAALIYIDVLLLINSSTAFTWNFLIVQFATLIALLGYF